MIPSPIKLQAEIIPFHDTDEEPNSIQVVRVSSSVWKDNRGAIHIDKIIAPLKKKSSGYQVLSEDVDNIGADQVVSHITNLADVKDGIYQVVTCNPRYSHWEEPYMDEYDYKLIPFKDSP
jgi:hypothetical protein